MTKNELKQLQYLPDEISRVEAEIERISNLEIEAEMQPYMYELFSLLQMRLKMCVSSFDRLSSFILNAPDKLLQDVLQLRFLLGRSWVDIANEVHSTPDACRMMCTRYLEGGVFRD